MLMDLHMHSNYSDGQHTPEQMIETAIALGYGAVALTDHVWKTSAWVPGYARHLEELKRKYGDRITVYSGIEAKVLDLEGDIDADTSFDPLVDLILGSIHRIPKQEGFYSKSEIGSLSMGKLIEHWTTAFLRLVDNPRVDIIAHPLSELKGFGVPASVLPIRELSERISESGKILEMNVRYNSPDEPIVKSCAERGVPIVISSDSHSTDALVRHSGTIKALSQHGLQVVDIHEYMRRKKSAGTQTGGNK